METEKKIKLGVDASGVDQGINSTYDKLQQRAKEMASQLTTEAEKRKGSAKEMVNYLHEQIRSYERISRIDFERQELRYKDILSRRPGDERAKAGLEGLREEKKNEKITQDLLRGILDGILKNGRQEVENNKRQVERELSKTPFAQRTFKQRYQAGLLGEEGGELGQEDIFQEGKRMRGRFHGYESMSIGRGGTPYFRLGGVESGGGLGGLLKMAGAVGVADLAFQAGKALWNKTQQYEQVVGTQYGISGRRPTEAAFGSWRYGFSGIDYVNRMAALERARRSSANIEPAVTNELMWERGGGINNQLYGQLEQLGFLGGGSAAALLGSSTAAFRSSGVIQKGDLSSLPDYMQILVSLGKQQVSKLGTIDMGVNMKMVAAISGLDDTMKKSPEAVATMVNAIHGGLSNAPSKQLEALQYSVLSSIRPGASFLQLAEMREMPFSKDNVKYLPAYLRALRKMSGGNQDAFTFNVSKAFGMSLHDAAKLVKGFTHGTLQKVLSEDFVNKAGVEVAKRAAEATTTKQKYEAGKTDVAVQTGEDVASIKEKVSDIAKSIKELNTTKAGRETIRQVFKEEFWWAVRNM